MSSSKRRRVRDQRRSYKAGRKATSVQPEAATQEQQNQPEQPGGSGGRYILPGAGLKNDRLERRALCQRFPIKKEEDRGVMMDRQVAIAIDPHSSNKEATQAFRAVLAADVVNMEQERRDEKIPDYHEHKHSGNVSMEKRREYFVMLGETLSPFPEAKEAVGKLLEERIRLNSKRDE